MKFRAFGRTGLQVSEIVFGCGMVGGLIIEKDDDTRRAAIDRALSAGVNWFDTAPQYGNGKSEEALGWLLASETRPFHISTKVMVDVSDLSDLRGQIEASVERSLVRLKRDSVTLLQLHNQIGSGGGARMLPAEEVMKRDGVLDILSDLRDRGLTRHIGITALGETDSILRVIRSGRIDSAQVYYNILNPSAAELLPAHWPGYRFDGVLQACAEHGVAAMNIRVFSAGVVATDFRKGREQPLTAGDTVESESAKARALFAVLGESYGDPAETALRFALAEPRLSCVVVGLGELSHLETALGAQAKGALPDEALAVIRQIYPDGVR
jgi:L-galactose dehydrogenase/L-glyceraldehyde 3-phosphate reductase